MHDFAKAGGTPIPLRPPKRLVTGGSYTICRHPMFLGYDLCALGVVLLLGSPGRSVSVCLFSSCCKPFFCAKKSGSCSSSLSSLASFTKARHLFCYRYPSSGIFSRDNGNLSGVQQQRVAVARAIVARAAIILADEPTASLDSETGSALIDLFEELNSKFETTFVFSSHDSRIIDRAGRIIHLLDGALLD